MRDEVRRKIGEGEEQGVEVEVGGNIPGTPVPDTDKTRR